MSDKFDIIVQSRLDQSNDAVNKLKQDVIALESKLKDTKIELNVTLGKDVLSKLQAEIASVVNVLKETNIKLGAQLTDGALEVIKTNIRQLETDMSDTRLQIGAEVRDGDLKKLQSEFAKAQNEIIGLNEKIAKLTEKAKEPTLSVEQMTEAIKRLNQESALVTSREVWDVITNEQIQQVDTYRDSLLQTRKLITSYADGKVSGQKEDITIDSLKAQKTLYSDLKSLNGEIFAIEKQLIKASDVQVGKLEKQKSVREQLAKEVRDTIKEHQLESMELERELQLTEELKKVQLQIAQAKDTDSQSSQTYAELTRLSREEFNIKKQMAGVEGELLNTLQQKLKIVMDTQMALQTDVGRGALFDAERHNELLTIRNKLQLDLLAKEDKLAQKEAIRIEKLNEKVNDVDFSKADFYDDQSIKDYMYAMQEAGAEITKFERKIDSAGNRQIQMTVATDTSKNKIKEFKYVIDESSSSLYKMSEAIKPNTSRMVGFVGQMGQAISKSITWAISMGLLYGSLQKLKDGIQTIKDLDKELTQVAISTGMTKEETHQLAIGYAELGKEMGKTAIEISKVNTELIRQGLSAEESFKRMQTILKLSASGGMGTEQSLQIVTSSVNALGEDAEKTADVLLRAGQVSASSAEGIGDALSKTASSAQATGMTLESLGATIATLIEVTQESPSSLGNSLKTLLARFNKIDEITGEVNADFNKVETAFRSVGIAFTDGAGQIRPVFDLLTDLSGQWENLDKNTKMYLATQSAGKTNLMPAHTAMCA